MNLTRAHINGTASVHPTAVIGSHPQHREWLEKDSNRWYPAHIREGARVGPLCVVDGGIDGPTVIGRDVYLMSQCHIGHDVRVGEGCEFAAGVVVSGHVRIAKYVRIGVGACIKPYVTIGEGARIGAGAVVIRNIPSNEVWAGCPARKLGEHEDNPLRPAVEPKPVASIWQVDGGQIIGVPERSPIQPAEVWPL